MTPEEFRFVRDVFSAACSLTREEQARYLEEACREAPHLRDEVEALLHSDSKLKVFDGALETRVLETETERSTAAELSSESAASIADLDDDDPLADPLLCNVPVVDGKKFLEPCVLISRLGTGGMGAVYLAQHRKFGIQVCVKCLWDVRGPSRGEYVQRFQREARLAASVSHENLVRIFEINHRHGLHYIVMEYVEGGTLRQLVERSGPLETHRAVELVRDGAKGLAVAHAAGIVHRDVKPDNILLTSGGAAKVADLGLARMGQAVDRSHITSTHDVAGSPRYMPPEQWESLSKTTPASDVWALGVTLYFLITGKDAYHANETTKIMKKIVLGDFPDVRLLCPGVPSEIVEILARCTGKDPADRYPDGRRLGDALDAALKSSSEKTKGTARLRETGVPPQRRSMVRRLPAIVMLLSVALVVSVVTLVVSRYVTTPPPSPPPDLSQHGLTHLGPNEQGYPEYRHEATGLTMVYLPGGSFPMGSDADDPGAEDDEKPRHEVTLSHFLISKYEVSHGVWRRVMARRPELLVESRAGSYSADRYPVGTVSWKTARVFCELTGLSLPTEAQWEYACRAGSTAAFAFGDELLPEHANFSSDGADDVPWPVHEGVPNAFGLLHMHGNLWEVCLDTYDEFFYRERDAFLVDPVNDAPPGQIVVRGGGYNEDDTRYLRSAHREAYDPTGVSENEELGFRPVYNLTPSDKR